jgi:asparagine synthase (glutamine-hydrolysing)
MCGILGVFGPAAPRLAHEFGAALAAIAHRGPDAEGIYQHELCLLGHRRLAILDLSSAANQPMRSGRDALVYNGEIYNHQDLRRSASLAAVRFRTNSDTETLLGLLKSEGRSAFDRCEGMFAGAYYNEDRQSLCLFRDSLGIKPLYFCELPSHGVVFSSEIKGILALKRQLGLTPAVDLEVLGCYLAYENYPQGSSLFKGVRALRPGEVLTFRRQGTGVQLSEHSYITFAAELEMGKRPDQAFYPELLEQTRAVVKESVNRHLLSDVPVGVYLSGGIDSSLVGTLAAARVSDVRGFTGYFETPEAFYDERALARETAVAAGISLETVKIGPADFKASFDRLMRSLDEPRMGMGTFSQYIVAARAAKERKVILAGHGGDEMFAGYPLFKVFYLMEAGLFSRSGVAVLRSLSGKEWPWILDQYSNAGLKGDVRFAPAIFPRPSLPVAATAAEAFRQERSVAPLEQLKAYYRETYLPGLLAVEDKISMAHGLETRVPLWSQKLLAWGQALPMRELMRTGRLKGLLRDAVKGLIPDAILKAPKRGFPTPLRLWLRAPLYEYARERLLAGDARLQALVSRREMERLLLSHKKWPLPFALDERRAHRIWMLLCLESWFRQYDVKVEGAVG